MTSLLDEAIESWEDVRGGVLSEITNVPAKQFDFRPADGARSFSELVVHVMEVGMMMVGELTREDGNFRRKPYPKLIEEYSKRIQNLSAKPELTAALRRTLSEGTKAFRQAGEIRMLQTIVRFDGKPGTRMAWFHHGIAHEMYHRGQLAMYARIMGIKPALTKLIEG